MSERVQRTLSEYGHTCQTNHTIKHFIQSCAETLLRRLSHPTLSRRKIQRTTLRPQSLPIHLQCNDDQECDNTNCRLSAKADFRASRLCPGDLEITDNESTSR